MRIKYRYLHYFKSGLAFKVPFIEEGKDDL